MAVLLSLDGSPPNGLGLTERRKKVEQVLELSNKDFTRLRENEQILPFAFLSSFVLLRHTKFLLFTIL